MNKHRWNTIHADTWAYASNNTEYVKGEHRYHRSAWFKLYWEDTDPEWAVPPARFHTEVAVIPLENQHATTDD